MKNRTIEPTTRESNIELLRVLTMIGVIILHYNNPLIGKGFIFAEGVNLYILYFIESLSVCAVDLFVLISGYFMCKSKRRCLIKPIKLIIQVIFFSVVIYLLQVANGIKVFSLKEILCCLVPNNYFLILYVTLYFVSPYINILMENLNFFQLRKMVMIFVVLFSVWPTLVDFLGEILGFEWRGLSSIGMYGSQWGYTIINFCLLYVIGAYIRIGKCERISEKHTNGKLLLSIIICTLILTLWAVGNDYIGFFAERSAWEYCNPIVILQATLIFQLFCNIKLKLNKVINELSKGTFTVFLLHGQLIGKLNIQKYVLSNPVIMIIHMLISSVIIYLICWSIYEAYERVLSPIYKILVKKMPMLNKDLFE